MDQMLAFLPETDGEITTITPIAFYKGWKI